MVAISRNKSLGASASSHVNVAKSVAAKTGEIKKSYQEKALEEAQERREFRRQQAETRKKQEQLAASKQSQKRHRGAANSRQELRKQQSEIRKKQQVLQENQSRQKVRVETDLLETAVNSVNSERSYLGVMLDFSMSAESRLSSTTKDSQVPFSVVEDTNFALKVTKLVKDQITTQFRTAMLAQANTKSDDIVILLN
jgi:flagellin-like hook-associated protein FlgL